MNLRHVIGGFLAAAAFLMALGAFAGCGSSAPDPGEEPGAIVHRIDSSAQLIGGREADGRVGDYLLDNGKVRFVVQDVGSASGWNIFGGSVVDIAVGSESGDDRLQEMFPQCDFRGFRPTKIEIADTGSTDRAGVLRLTGTDGGIPFLDAVLLRDPLQVTMTVEYILPPNSQTLEMSIHVKDARLSGARELACGLVLLSGNQNRLFFDKQGPDADRAAGKQPYIAADHWDAPTSWVLHRKGEPIDILIPQIEIAPLASEVKKLQANGTIEEHYFLSLGERDVERALAEMRSTFAEADPPSRRKVVVAIERDPNLAIPAKEIVLLFQNITDPDRKAYATTARASEDTGEVAAELPLGNYEVFLEAEGRPVESFELEVAQGEGPLRTTHALGGLGTVVVRAIELGLDGKAIGPTAARAMITQGHDAPASGAGYYEQYVYPPFDRFFLPAGDYTLLVSRGPEHELHKQNITVTSNQTLEVEAQLLRTVDRHGWVSGDFHVHSTRSTDSDVDMKWRVLGAIAEGVDILVSTDHDAVSDYSKLATKFEVTHMLRTVVGIEMSMLYGHMNGYPIDNKGVQSYWKPRWFVYDQDGRYERQREPGEVKDALHEAGVKVVQANHPRSGSGVFNHVELDSRTGQSGKPWFAPDVTEVLNGKRVDEYYEVRADLVGLIKAGRRVTGVGVSDTHSEMSGVGYARTYIRQDASSIDEIDLDAVWSAMKEGRVIAARGPLVELTARSGNSTAEIGDVLRAQGDVTLDIRVQAASWVKVDTLNLYKNGDLYRSFALDAEGPDASKPGLRFEGTVTATATADAFYFAEAIGSGNPLFFSDTVTMTNPIFVDEDGDGFSMTE